MKGNMELIFAAVTGSSLLNIFITILVVGVICWLLWWLIGYLAPPEPFNKMLRGLVAVVAVLFLIDALLKATGHGGFIHW